jgi:hypothetical protein
MSDFAALSPTYSPYEIGRALPFKRRNRREKCVCGNCLPVKPSGSNRCQL